ncbi:hypothetical protein [Cellulosimicrobium sp. CUA-896]|uniref:hypothetical protein n=1 Tax=Cellulosimicrobium sp. CUA-896 TaxID=1517881 RepID=UPI00095A88CD|nr:hypothetical protein [Cellulosimicrobium sp. CUA-896]OLT47134.1 hypothetical protein BJF88_17250 [Cellulosimicrobium sp. CUA-896]
MDRRTLDVALPVTYAGLVALSRLWFPGSTAGIALAGAFVLALYWGAFRHRLPAQVPPRDRADRPVDDAPAAGRPDDPPYGSA